MINLQNIILRLQHFWSDNGCVILQPYDQMMGAGTFHRATTLKALGKKDWRTAYVQPSRRPADGRYGENPNRLQQFYQFQVLLKPSPEDSQELFLKSLADIGISYKKHDIRFVEDDWESPTLGAAGLGWEVWCDGMEICQFTYFQQMGGIECNPVSTELTYGIERIAMFIQNKNNVFDIIYSGDMNNAGSCTTYGDIFQRNEREFSRYNFEEANTKDLWQEFFTQQRECKRLLNLDQPLALVAYDFCVGASHTFNVLDARKEVSHQKRAEMILEIRELASLCCQQWLEEEEKAKVT